MTRSARKSLVVSTFVTLVVSVLAVICALRSTPAIRQLNPLIDTDASVSIADAVIPNLNPRQLPRWIMSMTRDRHGDIWIASESQGVWRYKIRSGTCTQMNVADGLGDASAYAIACDRLGRIWVGHLNHGISVYDGKNWQVYEPVGELSQPRTLSGPLGNHVSAIKVSPLDGDVWIATEAGLSRYSESKDTWSYYTKADGLPSDQIQAMAIDRQGILYLGTQCDGICIGSPKDQFQSWRVVSAPNRAAPPYGFGPGLPSSMINDMLATSGGVIFAATAHGLAFSRDEGANWDYIRGKNFVEKSKALKAPPPDVELLRSENAVLAEDYITCLSEGDNDEIWVGYRLEGCERLKSENNKWKTTRAAPPKTFVKAILPVDELALIGTYDNQHIVPPGESLMRTDDGEVASQVSPKLPAAARISSADDLRQLLSSCLSRKLTNSASPVVAISDDWRTQGDWLGRYGRHTVLLGGMAVPPYIWGAAQSNVEFASTLGPHKSEGDRIRSWTRTLYTDDQRVLELPPVWFDRWLTAKETTPQMNRRDGHIDDHGEQYSYDFDGPSIYCSFEIPEGWHCLSIYQMNSNGQRGEGRLRDFRVALRQRSANQTFGDISAFEDQPELAVARVSWFWGGVYKRFLVRGPLPLTLEVDRNYSVNANLVAIMIDQFSETPEPYFDDDIMVPSPSTNPTQDINTIVSKLFHSYEEAYLRDPRLFSDDRSRVYCEVLRWILGQSGGNIESVPADLATIAATCCFHLAHFTEWEKLQRKLGMTPARDIEKGLRWEPKLENTSGLGFRYVNAFVTTNRINRVRK